jgi:hypothetical protein
MTPATPNAERMMQWLRNAQVKVTDQRIGLASDPESILNFPKAHPRQEQKEGRSD